MKTKIVLPFGRKTEERVWSIASEQFPRRSNWRSPSPTIQGRGVTVKEKNCGRYSSRCKYIRFEYIPMAQSWGVISDDGSQFAGRVLREGFRLVAPKGFFFTTDERGLKIAERRNPDNDFHFNSDDVTLQDSPLRRLLAQLREAKSIRAKQARAARLAKREDAIFRREVGSTRVMLADSRRAGNCVEGSLRYAEQKLGLDRQQILDGSYLFTVPAAKLLAVNGDVRVHNAVRAAWQRETLVSI